MVIKKIINFAVFIILFICKICFCETLTKEQAISHKELAKIYFSSGDYVSALKEYDYILNFDWQKKIKTDILLQRGLCFKYTDNYDRAIESLNSGLEIAPADPLLNLELAKIFEKTGLDNQALNIYNKIIGLDKSDRFESYYGIARIYQKFGLNSTAIEYYTNAITIKSEPQIYKNMSKCYKLLKNYQLSSAMLKQYIGFIEDIDEYIHLSFLYLIQNDHNSAMNVLQEALQKQPTRKDIVLHMAIVYFKTGDFEKSKQLISDLIEKNPQEGLLHFLLGFVIFFEKGNNELIKKEINISRQIAKSEMLKNYSLYFLDYLK